MKVKKIGIDKSPRFQSFLVFILSATIGVGTYLYLANYQENIQSKNDLTPVYVANSEIPSGTSFAEIRSRQLLKIAKIPKGELPPGAVTDLAVVDGSLKSKGLLQAGQLILASYFDAEARSDVSLKIPKGMLAIGLSVDDISRVGNFVLPGSRVAIFATGASESGGQMTRVLLNDALVLSIGSQTDLNLAPNSIAASPLVTIAVNQKDAQRIILSSQSMKISFALAYNNNPGALVTPVIKTAKSDIFS